MFFIEWVVMLWVQMGGGLGWLMGGENILGEVVSLDVDRVGGETRDVAAVVSNVSKTCTRETGRCCCGTLQ